ncbi:caspase family protein [Waterburya agarophytonicola K14]|uniref:Caspase family protein n=1 Tax=Waterburya agarophytonicola KI4 TaxID=2874699 RepID=A0A964FEB8_9CYAN|nr:caspase family protein [Waterburya agarophytonicola]MCC0175692.1 caspase family protein [Waterburya agarophytonicola KI4]
MGLDRRTFLQQAGLALFTWGATEIGLDSLGKSNNRLATSIKNYQQTLAQSTNRKLALLVGVNRYPHQENLDGCLTDVELQRELLIHRFGFNPQDIITLSDRQATRENIETAFVEHLSQQAETDDVVVFHFSGYGGQIKMPLSSEIAIAEDLNSVEYKLVNSLVPVDGMLPSKKTSISNSILQDTLLLLAQSLSTTKCTFVLDTSFNLSPRAKHSNFKIRSAAEVAEVPSSGELIFLNQLRENLASKGLKPSKRLLSLPGVVFSASGKNQIAVERQWDNFSAGLFTQALTQHLWQITPSNKVQVALAGAAATVEQVMGRQQQPSLNSPDKSAIAYYLATSDIPNAAGIISKANKNNFEVKLLGLPANILDSYGVNSCLSLVSSGSVDGNQTSLLQIKSRDGLLAKAQLLSTTTTHTIEEGDFLQESLRILERNLGLTLGLDADLQRIERVDATSALANISAVDSAVVLKEENADCLLGKVNHGNLETANKENSTFSYGLYTAGGILIGKTSGGDDEAVKIAIDRLKPHFNNLLAAKWLKLTNNEFSSKLKVDVSLASGGENPASVLSKATYLSDDKQSPGKKIAFPSKNSLSSVVNNVPILVKGSDLQLSLNNISDRQLYVLLLKIDVDSNIFALYTPAKSQPTEVETQLEDIAIATGSQLAIPQAESSWKWKVSDSIGINTLYAVFSVRPFAQTLKALAAQQNFKLDQQQLLNVTNPIAVIKSLMEDLHTASSVSNDLIANNNDVYALDVNSWATLDFVYEVSNA